MSLKSDRDDAYKAAQSIMEGAKAAGHPMNEEDSQQVLELIDRIKNLDLDIKKAKKEEAMLESLGSLGQSDVVVPASSEVQRYAGSLGEHFVQSKAYADLKGYSGERFTVSAPEFHDLGMMMKATTFVTGGTASGLTQTQYGQVVDWPLQRPTVAALLAQGALSATTLTYYVQTSAPGSASGGFATVGEAAQKPQLGFTFSPKTETLKKIAGWYAISDEAITDTPYLRSVIDNQLLVRLALAEEDQLLNRTGAGTDINGLLNQAGLTTTASGLTVASGTLGLNNLVALMNAATNIQVATFLQPDGLVVNPLDYQKLRLATDSGGQLYGGGPFTGAYGQGGLVTNPSVWGWNTVVTTSIPAGTALLGNFGIGAQLFRKGGVRVDSTNTDGTDFQLNIVKVRAEERILLAVYQPNCFCKVTLI